MMVLWDRQKQRTIPFYKFETFNKILINCEKGMWKVFRPFSTPSLRIMPFLLNIKRNILWFKHFLFDKFKKFSIVFEIFRKVLIRERPRNALVGSFPENMKSAYCWEYYYFLCIFLFLSLQTMHRDSFTSPFLVILIKYAMQ